MTACLAELSARARRGELTEAEDRQLRVLLGASLEARLAHRAGCEFDREDSVLPGDEARAARVTARVLASLEAPAVRRRRLGYKLGAAALLVAAAAAAAPTLVAGWRGGPRSAPTGVQPVVRPAAPSRARARASAPAPAPSPASLLAPTPAMSEPSRVARRVSARSALPEASGSEAPVRAESGPAALFAEANRSRRQGESARAVALYHELQRRYPAAGEAHAADIALGVLQSARSPSLALMHFGRYLESGGPLAPEALWGQAQALDALGRTEEARDGWRALLARYPRSAYASAARTKLGLEP
jgi:hypothetical protein